MKKLTAILLIAALTLALTGCGETDPAANPNADNRTTAITTIEEMPTANPNTDNRTAAITETPDILPMPTQPPPTKRPELEIPENGCWLCIYVETYHPDSYMGHDSAISVLAEIVECVEKFIKIVEECEEPYDVLVYKNITDYRGSGTPIFEGDMHRGIIVIKFYNNEKYSELFVYN
jgi:predicted small lipoprotein YifL